MRLEFRTERVVATLSGTANSLLGAEEAAMRYRLLGRARMSKDEGYDGPPLDFDMPPKGTEALHMERTPLPASVAILTTAEYEKRLMATRDWSSGGSSEERAEVEAVLGKAIERRGAYVYYLDADEARGQEYGHIEGVHADATLEIVVCAPDAQMPEVHRWLAAAAMGTCPLPDVELDGVVFAERPELVRELGVPSWTGFLDGRFPAVAEGYSVLMTPSRFATTSSKSFLVQRARRN